MSSILALGKTAALDGVLLHFHLGLGMNVFVPCQLETSGCKHIRVQVKMTHEVFPSQHDTLHKVLSLRDCLYTLFGIV